VKLVKGALLLFVVIGTIGGWVAGLFFGANLGGSVDSTTYAFVGAGLGLVGALIIGFVVKKALAILLLVVLLALLFGSTALPSLLARLAP
jgi:hypothetical protein